MLKTFKGGVYPACKKDLTVDKHIKKAPLPKRVVLPLLQHTGAPCDPVVAAGDMVKTGQVIGASDKFISSTIHASVSGKVLSVDKAPHPVLGSFRAVTIESDGRDEPGSAIKARNTIAGMSADEMRDAIKKAGIVGLGGAAFPTHVKLTPPANKPLDTVILNGVECEPYLTCDHRLMLEKTEEMIRGLDIVARLIGAKSVYIGIELNKMGAVLSMEKALRSHKEKPYKVEITVLKTKYPQGAEKQLIKAVTGREVPPGGLPFDVGCVVSNVGTVFAIYNALLVGKPLYERVVTLTGSSLREPSNLLARVGTPVRDLVEFCGGFSEYPVKMISGGPMMGLAQITLDAPVIKGTSGILFLSSGDVKEYKEYNCIRCAKCVDICPMRILPTEIARIVKKGGYAAANEYNIADCMECGACSFVCPSKIPLMQWIRIGKAEIAEAERKP
jgi:electron transport complex protein RnfC